MTPLAPSPLRLVPLPPHVSPKHHTALGEAAADSLSVVHPYTSMGHLVHMPGHTYQRVGRWADAVNTNKAALDADAAIAKRCGCKHKD
jgi:hypothetical protein